MIASEKPHENISGYIQFSFKKRFKVNTKKNSLEKIRNSGNYIYDYPDSFFGEDFQSNALYWCIYYETKIFTSVSFSILNQCTEADILL